MKIRDTARRAGRSLRQAKARTLLTSLAISVGAFTVTLALAAGAGGQAYTNDLVKNNGDTSNLRVLAKMEQGTDEPKEYGAQQEAARQGILTGSDIDKIKKIEHVVSVTPAYNVNASYMTRSDGTKKYETNLRIKADRTALPLTAGSLDNNQVSKGGIAVSETYLGVLGFKNAQEAIGKMVTVHIKKAQGFGGQSLASEDRQFKIVAVDKKTTTVLQYESALYISTEDGKAIHDFQTAGTGQTDQYGMVYVRVKDGVDVKAVQTAIENAGYAVFSLQDIQAALFQFIDIVQWGAAGFGFLAILASIFGIINTQYISVLERTQQIGLMKALGARRKDVGRLFRYEAAWVGFLGGSIGTILAVSTSFLNPFIAKSLELEEGTKLLQFNPVTSVVLILCLMLVAVFAGYFPARKAARLDPIEALRTE